MLAKNKAVPYAARLSGVTALRRAVMSHWHKDDPRAAQAYSAEEKSVVREDIVATAVLQTELPLIKTFAEIAQVVFRHDYPDRWCVAPVACLQLLPLPVCCRSSVDATAGCSSLAAAAWVAISSILCV